VLFPFTATRVIPAVAVLLPSRRPTFFFRPKGAFQRSPGQHPGSGAQKNSQPQRGDITVVPPLQGLKKGEHIPRALPWAAVGYPLGRKTLLNNYEVSGFLKSQNVLTLII